MGVYQSFGALQSGGKEELRSELQAIPNLSDVSMQDGMPRSTVDAAVVKVSENLRVVLTDVFAEARRLASESSSQKVD